MMIRTGIDRTAHYRCHLFLYQSMFGQTGQDWSVSVEAAVADSAGMSRAFLSESVPDVVDGILEESGQYKTLKVPLTWYCNLSAGANGDIPAAKLKDEKGLAYGFAKMHGVVLKKYDEYGMQFYCTLCKKWWNGGEHVTQSGKHLAYATDWTDAAITKHTYPEWKNLFNFLYPSTLAPQLRDSNAKNVTIAYPTVNVEGLGAKNTSACLKKDTDHDANLKDERDQLVVICNAQASIISEMKSAIDEIKARVSALERSNHNGDTYVRSDRCYHGTYKGRHVCRHEAYHPYDTGYTKYGGHNSWGANYGYQGRGAVTYYYKTDNDVDHYSY